MTKLTAPVRWGITTALYAGSALLAAYALAAWFRVLPPHTMQLVLTGVVALMAYALAVVVSALAIDWRQWLGAKVFPWRAALFAAAQVIVAISFSSGVIALAVWYIVVSTKGGQ